MPSRVLVSFLLLLLAWASFSCTTQGEDDPTPQQGLVGRWNEESWKSTVYDEKGAVLATNNTSSTPNYYVFKSNKTFDYYSVNLGGVIAGTYTYAPPSLTLAYQAGTFNGRYEIIEFTPAKLVLTSGKPQPGTSYTVEVLTLVKN
ncbi:lipocalin family protein [Hymenobacter qilianensis]|uniref:Lipocalin family protein n=1 Tax=Hymenobacter qilianensis TaxID=1385715 RepID=A0A7H0H176_9BACT|nr:lipocalin family protein [Hymenobacter qilianensis]QNP54292.1 lipocalin family protein [Hymenobacter qilianensis]